jgi:IclR family transcriptional regulator, acetate operon repressor
MSSVQSVDRALAILRALSSGPAGVTELADRVNLAKSTVSRMLSTLEENGAVEQIEGGGPYRLGPLITEIAAAVAPTRTLLQAAQPLLAELTAFTGEAAGLSVREGLLVRFILQSKQSGEVLVRDWTGTTSPLHVGPSGLVMLAYSDPETIAEYMARELEAFTPKTITDHAAVLARLAKIRDSGSEWVFGEFSTELNSVAAPVFDSAGRPTAAIHVHGPTYRFPGDRGDVITRRVVDASARLTEAIRVEQD